MATYTHKNLNDVKDMAPEFGMGPDMEARFAREPLKLERTGLTFFRFKPNFRVPFGHRHEGQEEVYVVVSGSVRVKLEDEVVELGEWDAIRVPGPVARSIQGGPEGAQLIAYGAPRGEQHDAEMIPDFWEDS